MERLAFELPEFTRLMWVTDRARAVWEPRLNRIRSAWLEMEWLAVAEGVRRCCVTFSTPPDYLARGSQWADKGLNALPLELQAVSTYSYSNRSLAYEPGKPFVFRFVLGKPADVVAFRAAYRTKDERAIAELLGYPPCCYEFFRRVWIDEGCVDTTWAMAAASAGPVNGDRVLRVAGPIEANILWRWMGVRPVSHLPCRCDCPQTVALGKQFMEIGRRAGYHQEMDWMREILSWPVEWSALHGIAEIKTPVLKVSSNTDATARKYVVQRAGDAYPLEGVHGLSFPYQVPDRRYLTDSRGFKKGLVNPLPLV